MQILFHLQVDESIIVLTYSDECGFQEVGDLVMHKINFLHVYMNWLEMILSNTKI